MCSDSVPATCADPTLPASNSLRREIAGVDGIVMLCAGVASSGGVSPTFLTAASRTPHTSPSLLAPASQPDRRGTGHRFSSSRPPPLTISCAPDRSSPSHPIPAPDVEQVCSLRRCAAYW